MLLHTRTPRGLVYVVEERGASTGEIDAREAEKARERKKQTITDTSQATAVHTKYMSTGRDGKEPIGRRGCGAEDHGDRDSGAISFVLPSANMLDPASLSLSSGTKGG